MALFGVGTNDEQPAIPDLRQAESVVEVGDAGGAREVLKEGPVSSRSGSGAQRRRLAECFPVTLTCLLARTIKGRRGSDASSSCRCCLATGKSCGREASTTNTSIRALGMYIRQYGRRSSPPPTEEQKSHTDTCGHANTHTPFSGSGSGSGAAPGSGSLSRNSTWTRSLLMDTALKPWLGRTSCSRLPVDQ